jgi:esterase/lipase
MKRTIRFKSGGHTLYGVFETPKKDNGIPILLLHGLTNSMRDCPLINEATTTLHKNGFPTFNFDYFGSGKSEGMYSDKTFSVLHQNTVDALDYVINKLKFNKIGLWGRSLGGILGSTISDDPHIFASVIISSTTHTNKTFKFCFNKGKPFSIPMKGTGAIKGKPQKIF